MHKSNYDIEVHVCENDEYGDESGRFTALTVEWPQEPEQETCLQLEAKNWYDGGEPIWTNDRLIQVCGYSFKYSQRGSWAGSMRWNVYYMPCYYAIGLINLLMRSGKFDLEEGYDYLADKWGRSSQLTMADFGYKDYPAWQHTGEGFHIHGPKQIGLFNNTVTDY